MSIPLLWLAGLCLHVPISLPATPGTAIAIQQGADDRVLDAIQAWLAAYYKGKVSVTDKDPLGKKSIGVRMHVIPPDEQTGLTAEHEIDLLTSAAAKLGTTDAVQRLLEVAAVGLDDVHYDVLMAPHVVRAAGEAALDEAKGDTVLDYLKQVAAGEEKVGSGAHGEAMRAAALRALGRRDDAALRPLLEGQLGDESSRVRAAAARGLDRLGDPAAVDALAARLQDETDGVVVSAIGTALQNMLLRSAADVSKETKQAAASAAAAALGRGDWRSDMALVDVLAAARSPVGVPALIGVLQRFVDEPDLVRDGTLSGVLRHRVRETLTDLTGAIYAADHPDQWRSFWAEQQAAVSERLASGAPKPAPKDDGDTVVQNFFGIPVQGTRIVFIVDLSGSMAFEMAGSNTTTTSATTSGRTGSGQTRLDYAQKELVRAVNALPSDASFNAVTFNGNPKAKRWMRTLVPATDANKRRFQKFVEGMRADGGTNSWEGLREGLDIESVSWGTGDPEKLDEIFFLSDGLPSAGDVVDAHEIVRLVQEMDRFGKVRINTIYIADKLSDADRRTAMMTGMRGDEFMRALAKATGGKYVEL